MARQVVAWFKRFLDGDKGYDDDLCPAPRAGSVVEARDTCPIELSGPAQLGRPTRRSQALP